jgi:tetratricopeptide (TPR) repeat protein
MGSGARYPLPPKRAPALFVLLALLLSACATPQLEGLKNDRQGLPERAEVPAVPFFPQEDNYCGPAALATTLAWSGLSVTQAEVAPVVYTPGREGTLQSDILAGARSYGRLAIPVKDLYQLMTVLAEGTPILVLQNLGLSWMPNWHYAVAVGYDLTGDWIALRSGREERQELKLETFERTWARSNHWALAITPPDRIPTIADESTAVAAAAGIERARRPDAASQAFAAVAQQWPDSFLAWMGLGNSRYALKQYDASELAYRRAATINPDAPEALNNLAYAVARQGRRDEALNLVEQAVDRAGDGAAQYRDSAAEIQAMPTIQ